MGRPLKKDVNGVNVIGSAAYGSAGEKEAGIVVEFFDTALHTDGAIIKQRGAKSYVVAALGDVYDENINFSDNTICCTLQAEVPAAEGQMRMSGEAPSGTVYIAKLTKRIATDFDGNRYTWAMSNFEDSTGDKIILTPVV